MLATKLKHMCFSINMYRANYIGLAALYAFSVNKSDAAD